MARTKTTYRTIHPETNEEVTFTKGGRSIRWITWGDLGKGLVHFGYSSQETYAKAVKAPRSSNPYAKRYEATSATVVEDETPTVEPVAAEEPQVRPMRAGLTVTPDSPRPGEMKLNVELDGEMIGVVFDESPAKLARGGFAAWSSKCRNRGGIVGFYSTKEDAAEAIAELYAEDGPDGSKAPEDAQQRAKFLALPTARRNEVALIAASVYESDGTRTVAEEWTHALEIDLMEHPDVDPETGKPVYVHAHGGTSKHLPDPDRPEKFTLCGLRWHLAAVSVRNGEIRRAPRFQILSLPECQGCATSHVARQARAAA
ncbi:hypothetical protein [Streptomyces shenzhenensis]|uniref:hypothetical protein n=1 Tax=Streptomyces shenzhenensis TaxID=943815 RepID=UPI0015F09FCA|nr:hypothetical protein [Streptomyces shenzhenensis]